MKNHKVLFGALLFCFAGVVAYGQDSSFRVDIKPTQTDVKNDQEFSVDAALRNITKKEKTINVWTCSYPKQWTADHPAIHVQVESCEQNTFTKIKLKAGEWYEFKVQVRVALSNASGPDEKVSFRLGYEDEAPLDDAEKQSIRIWSNPVTVNVTRPSEPAQ